MLIGGVAASDVMNVSVNPDNDDSIDNSINLVSQKYGNDQISNESISSLNSIATDDDGTDNLETDRESKQMTSSADLSSSANTALSSSSSSGTVLSSEVLRDSKTNISTSLKVSSTSLYYGQYLVVTLKDKNSNPLSGQKVLFNLTSLKKTYNVTTNSAGQAKLKMTKVGNIKTVISFAGKGNYTASRLSTTVKVKKASTSIKVSNTTFYSGQYLLITLKDSNSNPLSGLKVFTKASKHKKSYNLTTNSKGQVKLKFYTTGSFNVYLSFAGNSKYGASNYSGSVKVLKSGTKLSVSNTTVALSTPLVVNLTNKKTSKGVSNQTVKFYVGKKVYSVKTDSAGQAKLVVSSKKSFNVCIKYAGNKNLYSSNASATVNPVKCDVYVAYSSGSVAYGHSLTIGLKKNANREGVANKKLVIKITNLNKTYTKTTNSKGMVSIPVSQIGNLNFRVSFAGDSVFKSASSSKTVKGVKDSTKLSNSFNAIPRGDSYIVTLKDSSSKGLAKKKIVLNFNGKNYNLTTDSNGKASLKISKNAGSYSVNVTFGGTKYYNPSKLSKKLTVNNSLVKLSGVIKAAVALNSHVNFVNYLNSTYTATINGKKYSADELAYLMGEALVKINSGSTGGYIGFKNLSGKYKSSGSKINGNLKKANYLAIAKDIVKYVDAHKKIPSYKTTPLGKMEANLYIYALAKAVSYYNDDNKLPSYVNLRYIEIHGGVALNQNAKILNYKELFSKSEFAKYLVTGGYSALNTALKNKAKELTKGLVSDREKANAIFQYVRDYISYSFYSNSLKGAKKAFSTKSANCCDKANLVVAMCRAVGVYARYSHAQGCKFSSGLYTGHVWAQVYDRNTQTWYTADATSSRNSLGYIVNWNVKSYYKSKNYVLIPF